MEKGGDTYYMHVTALDGVYSSIAHRLHYSWASGGNFLSLFLL